MKKILWTLFGFLAVAIGLYPGVYFFVQDRKFGLLSNKSDALLADVWWNAGFYTHIIFGGLALLVGCVQFSPRVKSLLQPTIKHETNSPARSMFPDANTCFRTRRGTAIWRC